MLLASACVTWQCACPAQPAMPGVDCCWPAHMSPDNAPLHTQFSLACVQCAHKACAHCTDHDPTVWAAAQGASRRSRRSRPRTRAGASWTCALSTARSSGPGPASSRSTSASPPTGPPSRRALPLLLGTATACELKGDHQPLVFRFQVKHQHMRGCGCMC